MVGAEAEVDGSIRKEYVTETEAESNAADSPLSHTAQYYATHLPFPTIPRRAPASRTPTPLLQPRAVAPERRSTPHDNTRARRPQRKVLP